MPESVSGVDAIVDGLREHLWTRLDGRYVRLADAVAAVHAAADARTQEIERILRDRARLHDLPGQCAWRDALLDAADSLARRFPNEGTPHGEHPAHERGGRA